MAGGLRRWRNDQNLTQEGLAGIVRASGEELGIAVACSSQLVGRWERGEIPLPSHAYRRCLQRATGLSIQEMGFKLSWAFTDDDLEVAQTPPIFGLQPWPTSPRPDPAVAEPPIFAFGPLCRPGADPDVAAVRAMTRTATATDRQFGGDCMRRVLDAYLIECVKPLAAQEGPVATRQALLTTAAELAVRAAWMNLDVGDLVTCRSHMTTAFAWAQESGDSSVVALVLAMRTLEQIWLNNPRQAVINGTAAVRLSEGHSATLRAFCLGKYARALAMDGKTDHACEAIETSRILLDKAATTTDSDTLTCLDRYGQAYALADEVHCYYGMNRHGDVLQRYSESLDRQIDTMPARKRALTRATKIRSLIAVGHIDQACIETKELADAAAHVASKRVCDKLSSALIALRPYRKSAMVLDMEETVRGLVAGTLATRWLAHTSPSSTGV